MIVNMLLCIRNAVKYSTLKMKIGEARARGNDGQKLPLPIPRSRYIRKTPFYWGSPMWNTLPLQLRMMGKKLILKPIFNAVITNNIIRLIFDQ